MKHYRFIFIVAAALVASFMTGCADRVTRKLSDEQQGVVRKSATREELLQSLANNMNNFLAVRAKANLEVAKQDLLVPASLIDEGKRAAGKDYARKFAEGSITGSLLITHSPDGTRKIRVSGDLIGGTGYFMLLAINEKFSLILPQDLERKAAEKYRGDVYVGVEDREVPRIASVVSLRPQDVLDLLLTDEVYPVINNGRMLCYMETWPDFYILTFLRPDWPEHIYSKIWIERSNLTMAIHQIYDGVGNLVAEGRFGNYGRVRGKDSNLTVSLPKKIELLWPRDYLVLNAELSGIELNEPGFPSKHFEPDLSGYKVIRVPEDVQP